MGYNLKEFKNGICGYAPQGSIGSSGSDGYSVHYSSFNSSDESINNMILLIKQKKVLSTNPNYGLGQTIKYKIGDTIITIDSNMFVITGDNIDSCELKKIGCIKIISNTSGEGTDIFNGTNIKYQILNDQYFTKNDYNYIENGESYLYHHRDTNDSSVYGNYIKLNTPENFSSYISKMDGGFCTLILNFSSGLRLEKHINSSNYNESIFIDNRYFYPFGYSYMRKYWSLGSVINSYEDEKSSNTSISIQDNIKSESTKCMCSGYITFHVNYNEYRKKITIE